MYLQVAGDGEGRWQRMGALVIEIDIGSGIGVDIFVWNSTIINFADHGKLN